MIFYVLLLIVIIIAMFWLASFILSHAETVTITWGALGNIKIDSTDLLIYLVLSFVVVYFIVWLLKSIFGMRKNIQKYKHSRLSNKATQELAQGLVQFTSGHWVESEALLLNNVEYAETPLLNYLAAARAAHMQENYDRRDEHLKKANESGDNAKIAVAVSQADMQLGSHQVEQARATLVHLLELSPRHPYANKLLAKVYYRQEDWKSLFALLPDLQKQNLLKDSDCKKFEIMALKGIFQSAALKEQPTELHTLWKKLPANIKTKPQAILNYSNALTAFGDDKLSEKILLNALNKNWDGRLIERFGKIEHLNLNKSIQQAEKWLEEHDNSPELLLCLARLYRSNKLWGKSCYFYESGLNMAPNSEAYLEFAELLTQLKDDENAALCYQQGLRYCVNKKGEPLYLKTKKLADPTKAVKVEADVEDFYTI